jgi:hypothetical protein
MTQATWFDNLTRALAGDGNRRDFLRVLGGGLAGALAASILPRETDAAPAAQATCTPRPPVTVNVSAATDVLTAIVGATGAGNTVRKLTFASLGNATVSVSGVAAPVNSGATVQLPPGTTSVTLTVHAVDPTGATHVPFTVTDACGDWPTFVGSGAGALRSRAVLCPTGQATLTADVPAGSTTFPVDNASCFQVGDKFVLDAGTPNQEQFDIVAVTTATAQGRTQAQASGGAVHGGQLSQNPHRGGIRIKDFIPDGKHCIRIELIDPCDAGSVCCRTQDTDIDGTCCPSERCCDTGSGVSCNAESAFASDFFNCGFCRNRCNSDTADRCADFACKCGSSDACTNGQTCCDFGDGSGPKCHAPSEFLTNAKNCGRCGEVCQDANGGSICVNGQCSCGSGGPCTSPDVCLRGACCKSPNQVCGPINNRQCCDATTSFCGDGGFACCPKNRAACGPVCCGFGQICNSSSGACRSCGCTADSTFGPNNACLCGSGLPCDISQGKICKSGHCLCAADPGFALGSVNCDVTADNTFFATVKNQCPIGTTICRKTDPSLPAGLPDWDCSSSTCNPGYSPVTPICTTPG